MFPIRRPRAAPDVPQGLLITFEGGEGSGKTTQAIRLYLKLRQIGVPVLLAREPGSTQLGTQIRSWIKSQSDTTPLAETFLFAAARAQLVETVVNPAILKQGRVVVLDRFIDSTIAYQGYGRKSDIARIRQINELATGNLHPKLTVLLEIEPAEALRRLGSSDKQQLDLEAASIKRRFDPEQERRFERESIDFHKRVMDGYRMLAAQDRERWAVIKGHQKMHRIADAIWKRVHPLLGTHFGERYLSLLKNGSKYRFSQAISTFDPATLQHYVKENEW